MGRTSWICSHGHVALRTVAHVKRSQANPSPAQKAEDGVGMTSWICIYSHGHIALRYCSSCRERRVEEAERAEEHVSSRDIGCRERHNISIAFYGLSS